MIDNIEAIDEIIVNKFEVRKFEGVEVVEEKEETRCGLVSIEDLKNHINNYERMQFIDAKEIVIRTVDTIKNKRPTIPGKIKPMGPTGYILTEGKGWSIAPRKSYTGIESAKVFKGLIFFTDPENKDNTIFGEIISINRKV